MHDLFDMYHHFFHRMFMVLFNDKLVKIVAIEMYFLSLVSTAVFTLIWFNLVRRMRNRSWNKIINICQDTWYIGLLKRYTADLHLTVWTWKLKNCTLQEINFFLVQNVSQWISNSRSLTWGKGQGSEWSHLQRVTNAVHQILVGDL